MEWEEDYLILQNFILGKQIHKLDIEMHFADDDDFFVKKIERKIV